MKYNKRVHYGLSQFLNRQPTSSRDERKNLALEFE